MFRGNLYHPQVLNYCGFVVDDCFWNIDRINGFFIVMMKKLSQNYQYFFFISYLGNMKFEVLR